MKGDVINGENKRGIRNYWLVVAITNMAATVTEDITFARMKWK